MADILLKDRDGTPVAKEGVDKGINVLLTDGTEKIYVDSSEVPEPVTKTVELDFSESDSMTITPEDGQVFSSITIPKPKNLTEANIAADVDVAGIIGALVGGGNVKASYGWLWGNGSTLVIPHGLGVVPDFAVILSTDSGGSAWKRVPYGGLYVAAKLSHDHKDHRIAHVADASSYYTTIAYTTYTSDDIFRVDDANLKLGNYLHKTPSGTGCRYYWIAATGLV